MILLNSFLNRARPRIILEYMMQWGNLWWEIINRSPSTPISNTIIIINSEKKEKKKGTAFNHTHFTRKQWGPKPEAIKFVVITWNNELYILSYLYLQGRGEKKVTSLEQPESILGKSSRQMPSTLITVAMLIWGLQTQLLCDCNCRCGRQSKTRNKLIQTY